MLYGTFAPPYRGLHPPPGQQQATLCRLRLSGRAPGQQADIRLHLAGALSQVINNRPFRPQSQSIWCPKGAFWNGKVQQKHAPEKRAALPAVLGLKLDLHRERAAFGALSQETHLYDLKVNQLDALKGAV